MLLDGVPLRFMLPRFSRPNRARGRVPVKMAASGGWTRFFSGWKVSA